MNVSHPAAHVLPVHCSDGHQFELQLIRSNESLHTLLFLPALGVSGRHYIPFATALATQGISVAIHEWRGHGSSSVRAERHSNWGFEQLLLTDLSASLQQLIASGHPTTIIGGHSLGGQLASCLAALHPDIRRLWLVAAGSPWWKVFPAPLRWSLPIAYAALPVLAQLQGHLPGHRLGFGGREARELIADWALVGRSGNYRIPADIQKQMANWHGHCTGIFLSNDWMAPASSLEALQAKLPNAICQNTLISASATDKKADHFSWMKAPEEVAAALSGSAKKSSQNR